jgi:hypothetical protein
LKYFTTLLTDRPLLGSAAGFGAFFSAVLAWMKVISIVFGATGAILGVIVALYTLRNQRSESRYWKKHPDTLPPRKDR